MMLTLYENEWRYTGVERKIRKIIRKLEKNIWFMKMIGFEFSWHICSDIFVP